MDKPERKRRGPLTWLAARTWRFWIAVAVTLSVLYVASYEPACWAVGMGYVPLKQTESLYRPILGGPVAFRQAIRPLVFGEAADYGESELYTLHNRKRR